MVITLGTSWCYRHIGKDIIVSNCLKRNAKEFVRERLEPEQTFNMLSKIIFRKNIRQENHSDSKSDTASERRSTRQCGQQGIAAPGRRTAVQCIS